ncbi:hypothetical protein ACFLXJ_02870 [Chloroflexota bacterium]
MVKIESRSPSSWSLQASDAEAISHLKQAIADGKHWYVALLEAMGLWGSVEETRSGRIYRYLIAGEAFDWLLLAERLCDSVDGLLPVDEREALLFYGKPPVDLNPGQVKGIIGSSKYQQYLNYFYGITVEKALILAVQEEVHKERQVFGCVSEHEAANEAYRRIYGTTKTMLLRRFRREKGYPQLKSISLSELKEFTYWLFKYRLGQSEKAKVASDTRKALEQLRRLGAKRGFWGVLTTEGLFAERDW